MILDWLSLEYNIASFGILATIKNAAISELFCESSGDWGCEDHT
jgi:hypothetical protein